MKLSEVPGAKNRKPFPNTCRPVFEKASPPASVLKLATFLTLQFYIEIRVKLERWKCCQLYYNDTFNEKNSCTHAYRHAKSKQGGSVSRKIATYVDYAKSMTLLLQLMTGILRNSLIEP